MSSSMVDFMGVEELAAAAAVAAASLESSKKLEELTDEDVMQLTREDCRRYLKEKGMRRPSWNKAQAIQQVLSLKSLCHSPNAGVKRSASPSPDLEPEAPPPAKKAMEMTSIDLKAAAAAVTAGNSQLTMFYDGGVSVFDDVSPDKAYAIMLLAGNVKSWPSINVAGAAQPRIVVSSFQLPQARKASLHRFLQRRREKMTKEAAANDSSLACEKYASNDPGVNNASSSPPAPVSRPSDTEVST